jgi:hypothetical protein
MATLEEIITIEEICSPRTPTQFLEWFEDKLQEIKETNGVNDQVILRKGIGKFFYEEVFPLFRLLQNKRDVWRELKFKNVRGDQSFDVEIIGSKESEIPSYLEITIAENYKDYLRMRYFTEHGDVCMTGPVTHTGTKKTGLNVSVANEARKHTEMNQEMKDRIRIAITRKTSKAYPANTGLLVYFDDYGAFSRYKDKTVMDGFLDELDVGWIDRFSALYLVGASGNQIWERYRSEQPHQPDVE